MAVFGGGAFASDAAMEFLKELAEQAPERRAAVLERLFRSVPDQPGSAGYDAVPDRMVAAAGVVAAPSIGGGRFRDSLQAIAANDPTHDARLPEPVQGLAWSALDPLASVTDRWRRRRPDHADEAADTVAALTQVLDLGGGVLDDLDRIWNDACDHGADGEAPDGAPVGIERLGYLLRIHGSVMSGGLAFALEVNEPFRVRRAAEALRYFGLAPAAGLLEDTLARSLRDEDSESWPAGDDFDGLLDGDVLDSAFRAKAIEVPADFGRA